MSIVTRTGDDGTTGLMYNRRVSKTDARVEACGAVDELMAGLGAVRAVAGPVRARELHAIQKELVLMMGELATLPEDLEKYQEHFTPLTTEAVERLDEWVRGIEPALPQFHDWVLPGGSVAGAALDLSRAVCRRAERCVWDLIERGGVREVPAVYLNRLADLLWIMARAVEQEEDGGGPGAVIV